LNRTCMPSSPPFFPMTHQNKRCRILDPWRCTAHIGFVRTPLIINGMCSHSYTQHTLVRYLEHAATRGYRRHRRRWEREEGHAREALQQNTRGWLVLPISTLELWRHRTQDDGDVYVHYIYFCIEKKSTYSRVGLCLKLGKFIVVTYGFYATRGKI
jgi:hypothetical protein